MTAALPPDWASNTNYSAGPDTGTPTKVDPASDANGFVAGVIAAPQHVNFVVNKQAAIGRRAFQMAALRLREARSSALTITDTAESMAAVQVSALDVALAIKTAQAIAVGDGGRTNSQGVPTQITSLVTDAAFLSSGVSAGDIGVIGTGGNRFSNSGDGGVTWGTTSDVGAVPQRLIASANGGSWVTAPGAPSGGNHVIRLGSNGGNWVSNTTSVPSGQMFRGLAATSSMTFACYDDASGFPDFIAATGNPWTDTGGTVPNSTSFDEGGCVVGNRGSVNYHAGRRSSGATIQVSSSADGATWTTLALIGSPLTSTFSSVPRILMCQNTGLLVIAAPLSSSQLALYASLDGVDWVGPEFLNPSPGVDAIALAGGRLFMTNDDMLFASDGIGIL